jgi:hypothetical protein
MDGWAAGPNVASVGVDITTQTNAACVEAGGTAANCQIPDLTGPITITATSADIADQAYTYILVATHNATTGATSWTNSTGTCTAKGLC